MHYRRIIEKQIGRLLTSDETVHHKDGNQKNNTLSNLQLMTRSTHASLHMAGRTLPNSTKAKLQHQSRQRRPGAKLFMEDIPIIRKMLRDKIRHWVIGIAYGVSKKTISDIRTDRSWSWV